MKAIQAKDWDRNVDSYIWEETGNGSLRMVTGIRKDWWIVTGGVSWCCTPATTLYVFDSDEERQKTQAEFRNRLREQRGL